MSVCRAGIFKYNPKRYVVYIEDTVLLPLEFKCVHVFTFYRISSLVVTNNQIKIHG